MTDADQARRYAWRVLSVTSLGVLLAGANTSTLDVALPVVARHFSASATAASWLLLSYGRWPRSPAATTSPSAC